MSKVKSVYIENLGCAKNQVDAEVMIAQFEGDHCVVCDEPEKADLIVVNTCGFINPAKEESVGRLLELKQAFPDKKVIAAGCLSQRYADSLKDSLREIDGFIGNWNLENVPGRIESLLKSDKRVDCESFVLPKDDSFLGLTQAAGDGDYLHLTQNSFRNKRLNPDGYAYVKISEGCHHGCAYCAIPLIRGTVVSRSINDITDEISALVDAGVKEMELIAQDLFSYGIDFKKKADFVDDGSIPFIELLKAILRIEKDFTIRLLYIHPDALDLSLLDLINSDKRLLAYLDIPFQHASEPILRSMGRTGNRASYLEMVKKIREKVPTAILRSTFLLGYPGEKRADLDEVYEFLKEAQLDWVGFFVYSREEGTRAAKMTNRFKNSRTVKAATAYKPKLEQLQQEITQNRLEKYVGTEMDILIEEAIEGENLYLGRCWIQAPEVDGLTVVDAKNLTPGEIVRCKIIKRNGIDLEAIVVS